MKTTGKTAIAMVAASLFLIACGAGNKNTTASEETTENTAVEATVKTPTLKAAKADVAAKMLNKIMASQARTDEPQNKEKNFTAADFKENGVWDCEILSEPKGSYAHYYEHFWAVEMADGKVLGFFFRDGEEYDTDDEGNQCDMESVINTAMAFELQGDNIVDVTEKYIPNRKSIVPYTTIEADLIWNVYSTHYDFGKIRTDVDSDGDCDVIYFAWDGVTFVVSEP